MKIGIAGDTHGNIQAVRKILQKAEPVEYWLHTGDHGRDAIYLSEKSGLPILAVQGNCDRNDEGFNIDEFIFLEGKNIWVTHGHRYLHGTDTQELVWWAHRLEADIVVFGHTHVPMVKWYGDVLLINPGSASRPRGGSEAGFAVLTLKEGVKPEVEFINLD